MKEVVLLLSEKKYEDATRRMETLSAQDIPAWMKSGLLVEMASANLYSDQSGKAREQLQAAVAAGFDDCITLKEEPFTALQKDSDFAKLYAAMRISPADLQELFWLKKEMSNVDHEIQMMITENINRLDHGPTKIAQVTIPLRATKSPGVLYLREILETFQALQIEYVGKSDMERMEHVASMAVINGPPDASEVLLSSQNADRIAEQRRREVHTREFRPDPLLSTEPQVCPQ